MKVLETFDATPNTNLLDVLGNSGYSLEAAIADIIDNSIAAEASNINIYMRYKENESSISIIDDGYGMSLKKLKSASIIAFKNMLEKRKENDLGRFSTGINSASASMCSHLIIQSKTCDDKYNTISIDYDLMKEKQSWLCNVVEYDQDFINANHGTAIVWNNLKEIASAENKIDFYRKADKVEKHISHVFNDYIMNGVNIFLNGNKIAGWDPFFETNPKTSVVRNEIKEYHGEKISVKIYILPPYNNLNSNEQNYMRGNGLSEQQGFYIYRRDRLIKEGGWLGLEDFTISNKYDYARIRVDIDITLDKYFKPNFLKNELFIPDDLKDYFSSVAKIARNESRKNYNYMKVPAVIKSPKINGNIPVWAIKNTFQGILISVNPEHPIINYLCKDMPVGNRNKLFKLLSNNIPIGEIQRSGVSNEQTKYYNMIGEITDLYEQLKNENMEDKDILVKMASCEPFCTNQEYISELIDFFSNKGVI